MTPAVSVIVPTRHRPHLVGRAVESILNQTFADFEIVLVDNNPPPSRLSCRPEHFPWLSHHRLHLFENDRVRNPAMARNLGLEAARGKWVTYLDDDDEYRQEKLDRQLAAAERTGIPLGVCGVLHHLPGRRRLRHWDAEEIRGDDLLLTFFGTPCMFHQRVPEIRFDEELDAGEDVHYFHQLIDYFDLDRVFNVSDTLVDVHQQPGGHVNLNARAVWRAHQTILRQFGSRYSEKAAAAFHTQGRLRYCTMEPGHGFEMLRICAGLARLRGLAERRLILNCLLWQIPWLRHWLIH